MNKDLARWKGSADTAADVRHQIHMRFGLGEARKYDPLKNCFTFKTWRAMGYHVKKGEKALRSFTVLEKTVKENGVEKKIRFQKSVCLFYQCQVEK
jgi:N-terminal domain of anti-restriction factor ArdC